MSGAHSFNENVKQGQKEVCVMEENKGDDKERETYPKINQTLNRDKTGGCVSPNRDGR